MNISINSVHFKADAKLESFISERISKLQTFYEELIGGEVTLRVDAKEKPENKIVEIRLSVKGNDLYAKKQSSSFEQSTDDTIEALRRQLKKHKEKERGR